MGARNATAASVHVHSGRCVLRHPIIGAAATSTWINIVGRVMGEVTYCEREFLLDMKPPRCSWGNRTQIPRKGQDDKLRTKRGRLG